MGARQNPKIILLQYAHVHVHNPQPMKKNMKPTNIFLDDECKKHIIRKGKQQGISAAEYVRLLIRHDIKSVGGLGGSLLTKVK